MGGVKAERVVNEPTAAGRGYSLDRKKERNILVINLDDVTYDITLLTIDDGVFEILMSTSIYLAGKCLIARTSPFIPSGTELIDTDAFCMIQ